MSTARERRAATLLAAGVLAATVLAVVVLHARGLSGGFLSDDFGILDLMSRHDREGTLGAWLVARFFGPLGSGNFGYRPLGLVSYAIDWRLFGASPGGWHLTSLLLHLANVALVYRVTSAWLVPTPQARTAGAFAAALFAAFPFAGEVTFWLAARFDLLAALFCLLYLATLTGGPRPADVPRQLLRVTLLIAALLGKESAMPLPVIAFVIEVALAKGEAAASWRARITFAMRDLAPTWIAFAAYLGWRFALFGTPIKVYPQSSPPRDLHEYFDRLAMFGALLTRQTNTSPSWTWAVAAAVLVVVLTVAVAVGRRRVPRTGELLVAACAIAATIYVLAPAASFPSATSGGEGARNYYIGWIYAAVAIGVAVAELRIGRIAAIALAAWLLVGQHGSLGQWHAASRQMQAVTSAVPAFAAGIARDGYALLLLPDRIGVAVFARNAQGGIVNRPVLADDHLDRIAGMTENDLPNWRQHFEDDTIARLKGVAQFDPARFAGAFCWNPDGARFVQVAPAGAVTDFDTWERELRAGVARGGCLRGTLENV